MNTEANKIIDLISCDEETAYKMLHLGITAHAIERAINSPKAIADAIGYLAKELAKATSIIGAFKELIPARRGIKSLHSGKFRSLKRIT